MEVISTRPSGIIAVSDGDRVRRRPAPTIRSPTRLTQPPGDHHLGVEDEQPDRTDAPAHPPQHAVDRGAQLRRNEREPLGLARELVRVRVGADRVTTRGALARDHDRARERLIARLLVDRVGLAGQHGLVDLQARVSTTTASAGTWSPARRTRMSSSTTPLGRDLRLGAVAAHPCARRVEEGEAVERGLGAELLPASDDRVGERGEAEDRVLPAAEHQQDAEAREDDRR